MVLNKNAYFFLLFQTPSQLLIEAIQCQVDQNMTSTNLLILTKNDKIMIIFGSIRVIKQPRRTKRYFYSPQSNSFIVYTNRTIIQRIC